MHNDKPLDNGHVSIFSSQVQSSVLRAIKSADGAGSIADDIAYNPVCINNDCVNLKHVFFKLQN